MRLLTATITLLLACQTAFATPAETLELGKTLLGQGDSAGAESEFQAVVESADADAEQVEEALFWQQMIYSGDFLSALALLQPLQASSPEDHELKRRVAQQMGLARWAFFVAGGNFLNATAIGPSLGEVKTTLPGMGEQDVAMLLATLASRETLAQILSEYSTNPSVAEGLLQRTNQYSMYLALSDALPGLADSTNEQVRSRVGRGESFDQLHFLDWMSRVALDMDRLVTEPNGPDLAGMGRRCDERIIKLGGGDQANIYVREARARSGH